MPTKHAHRRCALSCHSFYTNWESGFEQGGLLLPTYETLVARKQVLRCRAPWSACSVCKPVKACARVPAARLLEGGGPQKRVVPGVYRAHTVDLGRSKRACWMSSSGVRTLDGQAGTGGEPTVAEPDAAAREARLAWKSGRVTQSRRPSHSNRDAQIAHNGATWL